MFGGRFLLLFNYQSLSLLPEHAAAMYQWLEADM